MPRVCQCCLPLKSGELVVSCPTPFTGVFDFLEQLWTCEEMNWNPTGTELCFILARHNIKIFILLVNYQVAMALSWHD